MLLCPGPPHQLIIVSVRAMDGKDPAAAAALLPRGLRALWVGPHRAEMQYTPLDKTGGVLAQREGALGVDDPLYAVLQLECKALWGYDELAGVLAASLPMGTFCPPVALYGGTGHTIELVVLVADRRGHWKELCDTCPPSRLAAQQVALGIAEVVDRLHKANLVFYDAAAREAQLHRGIVVRIEDDTVQVRLAAAAAEVVKKGGDGEDRQEEERDVLWVVKAVRRLASSALGGGVVFSADGWPRGAASGKLVAGLLFLTCGCCGEERSIHKLASCSAGHVVCVSCVERCCSSSSWALELGAMPCPSYSGGSLSPRPPCHYSLKRLFMMGVDQKAIGGLITAQLMIHEKVVCHTAKVRESALAARRALEPDGRKKVVSAHVEDTVIPVCCPRCGGHVDVAGFAVLMCPLCGCGSCAWCGSDCGEDAHGHVINCSKRGGARPFSMPFYASSGSFERAQNRRRRGAVDKLLRDCKDASFAAELIRDFDARMIELGGSPTSPSSSAGAPDDMRDGQEAAAMWCGV